MKTELQKPPVGNKHNRSQPPVRRAAGRSGRANGPARLPHGPLARCAECGDTARVHILEAYRSGNPVTRALCVTCATGPSDAAAPARARLSGSVLAVVIGLCLGAISLGADVLIPHSEPGFGWIQRGGVVGGAVLILLGTLMRVDLIALVGLFAFCGALAKDWLDAAPAPGLGWKQQALLSAAAACLIYGVAGRRAKQVLLARLHAAVAQIRKPGRSAAALATGTAR